MKVVHLTATADRAGGAETYTLGVAAAQGARGDDIWVAHRYGGDGIDGGVADLPWSSWLDLRSGLEELAPDVVHVNGSPLDAGQFTELQGLYPTVRSLHDYSFACATGELWYRGGAECPRAHGAGCLPSFAVHGCAHRTDLRGPVRELARIRRSLPVLREAPAVVAHSDYIREVAVRNGIPADRCHVVRYYGTRCAAPPPLPAARDVAFVGRVVARKGLDVLLEALAAKPAAWDTLHVVGDGWDRARCERLAAQLGIAERVRMHGWLAEDEVRDVIQAARVVAVPSLWPEPGAVIAFETMALGRAIVASRVGGIPEIVEHEATGLLVPPGDATALGGAIARVLGDDDLARWLGVEAWRRSEHYTVDDNVAALDLVYAEARA